MICQNCNKEHDGSFGSGRFCCQACAGSFSTKAKRLEINKKVSESMFGKISPRRGTGKNSKFKDCEKTTCKHCQKEFNKIKTKQIFCSLKCSRLSLGFSKKGVLLTEAQRQNISNGRKKAFEENKIKITGGTTKWIQYKSIKVQGSFEYRFCAVLDRLLSDGKIKSWSYSTERVKYIGLDKKDHVYIIDFTVERLDGTKYFVEVKGFLRPNDLHKINCAIQSGRELYIAFDKQIKEQEAALWIGLQFQ